MTTAPFLVGGGRVEHRSHAYPEPGPGQLLIRPRANALCGSDHGLFRDGSPVVAGHEAAGTVVAAGPGTATAVGTRGVIYLMAYCGRCRSCHAGATNLCLDKAGDMGFDRDGGLGPLEVVEERMFFPIGHDLPFPLATMLLDVMGTSGAALNRALSLRPDLDSLLITGAGPVGVGVLATARLGLGGDVPIYISDVSEWRLSFAESLGGIPVHADYLGRIVTHTFDVSETALAFETFLSGESGKVVVTQEDD
ncbi:alcohol dehydrogenase catalytic domain-containing protein [Nonomuraea sp. NPDC046802]|uniref:alcohol dehydrogenase catalytic domain-containing protein n=1 Tax=Nonomuraea sp. NPDC046802 TaxID=3154919 RepID=UPI0034062906